MISGKLSVAKVKSLGAGRHADGNNLYLVVDPTGARRWVVRLTITGVRNKNGRPMRTDIGLGGFPLVSLQDARLKALEHRRLAAQGFHPKQVARQNSTTFEQVALKVFEERRATWKNDKHQQQWINTLNTYAFPVIGQKTVKSITQEDLLNIVQPIWVKRNETARRVLQRMEVVFDRCRAEGIMLGDNPATLIKKSSILPRLTEPKKHHEALPYKDVPDFYSKSSQLSSHVSNALAFTILTAARSGSVIKMMWSEVDFSEAIWTVPAENMKTKKEFRVPLSEQALKILEFQKKFEEKYVFPGRKTGTAMSLNSMTKVAKTLSNKPITTHGFRSSFRDWAGETTNASRDVMEHCLAHTVGNAVQQAYARSDLFPKRRLLMENWASFVYSEMEFDDFDVIERD